MTKKKIKRPGDLAPLGVRSTIKGNYKFDEVFKHIFDQIKNLHKVNR